jgi:hypothetical protein
MESLNDFEDDIAVREAPTYDSQQDIDNANARVPSLKPGSTTNKRYTTDPKLAKTVLVNSGWKCALDGFDGHTHNTFDTKTGNRYLEAHHLVPMKAQKDFYPGYDLVTRGIYYGARLLSSQKEREFSGEDFDEIKKVYSIWICMNGPKYLQNTITEYKIQQNKLYGNYSKPARYDLMSVVMLCLGEAEKLSSQGDEYQELLRLLSVLASEEVSASEKLHILEEEYHIATTRELEGKVNIMCNWSEGVIERVTQRVTEQVTQQVTQQVTYQVLLRSVENVMKALNVSEKQACEILAIDIRMLEEMKASMMEKVIR